MDKYYKPKLEEFHVGFEYELRSNVYPVDEFWRFPVKKMEFTETTCKDINTLNRFALDLYDGDIRVKYLDNEDILSLGWADGDLQGLGGYIRNWGTNIEYQLYYDPSNQYLQVYDFFSNPIFQGKIKNKSELKRLMYQLEIIE
jgi:hypothetical protein